MVTFLEKQLIEMCVMMSLYLVYFIMFFVEVTLIKI